MLAVSRGRMEMVELTLETGADINATDEVRHERITVKSAAYRCHSTKFLILNY